MVKEENGTSEFPIDQVTELIKVCIAILPIFDRSVKNRFLLYLVVKVSN